MTNRLINNIYLLNLDKRNDRLLFMNYKLNELGISYKRIPAILGTQYKDSYDKYINKINKIKKNNKIKILNKQNFKPINSIGAYGLMLTYKDIISPLGFKKNKNIIVFEDDICFHHNFKEQFLKYKDIINSYDVVWLGCQFFNWDKNIESIIKKKGYYDVVIKNKNDYNIYKIYGTYCIAYSPRFLRILKQNIDKDFDTKYIKSIDCYITYLLFKYKTFKSCFIQPNLAIPQILESDNIDARCINDMAKTRKWDMTLYKYNDATAYFSNIYNKIMKDGLSLRNIKKNLYNDITNMQLSRLIEENNKSFVFIITSYNNEKWVYKNLLSIVNQKYLFWRIIYVNDCSTDRTLEYVNNFVEEYNIGPKITIIETEQQMRQSYGRFMAAKLCYNDEICCMLDGDDWLVDDCDIFRRLW